MDIQRLIAQLKINPAFSIAHELASEVHKDDKRSDGLPYMTHIDKVIYLTWESMRYSQPGTTILLAVIVAALHDAFEDHPDTCSLIRINGVLQGKLDGDQINDVIQAIKVISKDPKSNPRTYVEYVRDVLKNPLARAVKKADLRHNISDNCPKGSRRDKYELTLAILNDHESFNA